MDYYVGTITIFGGNFAPQGWAFCAGQLLSVSEYPTLFEFIGTTYGGDGVQTFALPDLRRCSVIGAGRGEGWALGETVGSESGLKAGSGPSVTPYLVCNYIIALTGSSPSAD